MTPAPWLAENVLEVAVVSGEPGVARAVLLRGAEIVEGIDTAVRRRGRSDHLADGPGKLAQALGVTDEMDGHDVSQAPLRLLEPRRAVKSFVTGPRIGISKATDRPWRSLSLSAPAPP